MRHFLNTPTSVAVAILILSGSCASAQSAPTGKSSGSQNTSGAQQPTGQQGGGPQGGSGTAFFDSQMLAFASVDQLAYAIANKVCLGSTPSPIQSKIIIYDQVSFQNLQAWQAFKAALSTLDGEYQTLTDTIDALPASLKSAALPPVVIQPYSASPSAPAAAAARGSFFAGSDVSGLVGALGASTTNTASTFTIPDSSVAVALIHQFKRVDPNAPCKDRLLNLIYYPLLGNAGESDASKKEIQSLFAPLNAKRLKIQTYLATRPQQSGKQQSQKPGVAQQQGPNTSSQSDPFETAFADLNTQYDNIVATLTSSISQNQTSPSGSTAAGVTSIIQGFELETALKDDRTYILYADLVAAGGIQRDVKNLFTVLFTGDLISYSGGVVLNYALIKASDSAIQAADVLRYRAPYTHLRDSQTNANAGNTVAGDNMQSLQ